MKIRTDNAIYVQRRDINHISMLGINIPSTIFLKTYEKIVESTDNFNGFIKFEKEEEIKFLDNLDCIVDFIKYNNYSEIQLIEYILNLKSRLNGFNSDYIILSLHDILRYKQGQYKLEIPEDHRIVGTCLLGYTDKEWPVKPRKENFVKIK